MTNKEIREKVLKIVTFHGDDGTSGYLLSDEQVDQILQIVDEEVLEERNNGDLVSNCCAWDFNPFGMEKEEGIYQERCLKCGKLCEPVYISENDIKNIRNLDELSSLKKV